MTQLKYILVTLLVLSGAAMAQDKPATAKDQPSEEKLAQLEKETMEKAGKEIGEVLKKYKLKFNIQMLVSDKGSKPLVSLERDIAS